MNDAVEVDTTPIQVDTTPIQMDFATPGNLKDEKAWVDPVDLAIGAALKRTPVPAGVFSGRWATHDDVEILDRGDGEVDLKVAGLRVLVRDFGVAIDPGKVDADGLIWLNDDAFRSLARALRSVEGALGRCQAAEAA